MRLETFAGILGWAAIFLITVTFHEFCHGLLADRLGDHTAREAGRLTLNPFRHVDPFWTVLFPLFLFFSTRGQFAIGMAKPVPVNFMNLRHPRRDMILVALAGPAANLILAGGLASLLRIFPNGFLLGAVYFNLGLAVFNLIPVPPLDGSRVLLGMLPLALARLYARVEPYGFLIVFVLYFVGIIHALVVPGINGFCRLLNVPPILLS